METLNTTKANARKAHKAADAKGKKLLEDLFGAETFSMKVTDRIKTFADVLQDQGISEDEFNDRIANDTQDEADYKRGKLIALALNEGVLDPAATWYWPVFNREAGHGFAYVNYDYWYDISYVGARLFFKSLELAEYAGNTFPDIYRSLCIPY